MDGFIVVILVIAISGAGGYFLGYQVGHKKGFILGEEKGKKAGISHGRILEKQGK